MLTNEAQFAVKRAVILAAGQGSRLRRANELPKPLVTLNGRRLVDYTLEAVAASGIREVLIVTGYRESELRAVIGDRGPEGLPIKFVSNPHWDGPASTSLRAARAWCSDAPFLLLMSDHMVSHHFIRRLLAGAPAGSSAVAADSGPRESAYVAEATLLEFGPDRRVTAIGKGRERVDGLDAGAFVLGPEVWDAVDATPERCELSVIFSHLANTSGLYAVDVSGTFWYDIDTADDLASAAHLRTVHTL